MTNFTVPANYLAEGTIQQDADGNNVIHATGLPLSDFLSSEGYDPSKAEVTISVDDQYIVDDQDADGDGETDTCIENGALISSVEIDADGDGKADYYLKAQNPNNAQISTNNQANGNVAEFNGTYTIYDADGNEAGSFSGNVFIASDGGFAKDGDKVVVPNDDQAFIIDDIVVVCFARGTWIDTPTGRRLVEDLRVGDLVSTLDHGPQPIRWLGSSWLGSRTLALNPNLLPIRIAAGALGPMLPEQDLIVSPQHRVMLSSRIVRQMFDTDEVLVPAKKLLGLPGVGVDVVNSVEYFHILLDRHEVVVANGAPAETLLLGPMAVRALGRDACREVALIFPDLKAPGFEPVSARRIAEPGRVHRLVERHLKNNRQVDEGYRPAPGA